MILQYFDMKKGAEVMKNIFNSDTYLAGI